MKIIMSREIKFRAWDNKAKHWLLGYDYGTLGGFSLFGECMLMGEWSAILNRFILKASDRSPDDLIVMQYTGLKDKNGKDIYEGDIFRVEEYGDEHDRMYHLVIVWVQEWAMFCTLTNGEYHDYLAIGLKALDEPMFWTYTLEDTNDRRFFLCGNIYENPNLLSQ